MEEIVANTDKSQDFLDSLPQLEAGEKFLFACNEKVVCFNRCCAELTLPLTPYDTLCMCRHMGIDTKDFMNRYVTLHTYPDTGFPLPLLKMIDDPNEACPFVRQAGCSIYEDRPGACRMYPLGRGTKLGRDGKPDERFFMVKEDHCCGFNAGNNITAKEWMDNQNMQPYNESNDRLMRIMSMVKVTGKPITPKMSTMCFLALYQLDKFKDFIVEMNLFDKVEISQERKDSIMQNPAEVLNFSYDWIELVLFGQCPSLKRKP